MVVVVVVALCLISVPLIRKTISFPYNRMMLIATLASRYFTAAAKAPATTLSSFDALGDCTTTSYYSTCYYDTSGGLVQKQFSPLFVMMYCNNKICFLSRFLVSCPCVQVK